MRKITKPKLAAIVAMAENRVIGYKNTLPWHLPEDLKHFKSVTMNKPIIMGRLTFESIGRPLPGRLNIVVSRQNSWSYPGVSVTHSLESAIALGEREAIAEHVDEIMIIGGSNLYAQALPLLDLLYVTEIHDVIDGDASFPALPESQWQEMDRRGPFSSEKNALRYSFVIFQKHAGV